MITDSSRAPWADQPYTLLSTGHIDKAKNAHYAHRCAWEMTHAHNCLLRGLNSILQQAPAIPDSRSDRYSPEDVKDLLLYTEAWAKVLEHHHDVEERVLFPALQKIDGVRPERFQAPLDQHTKIHEGLGKLLEFTATTSEQPSEYRWHTLRDSIDSFATEMYEHLKDEINMLLDLETVSSEAVAQCLKEAEKAATRDVSLELLSNVFPVVLGASDKTYENGNDWPRLPFIMPYVIKYWFARQRRGAWRFNPCDLSGNPRALEMLEKYSTQEAPVRGQK